MKKIIFRHLIFLLPLISFAQQSKIDSLLILIKKDNEDTNKVNHFNTLSKELRYNNPDTSLILCNQALSLSEKLEWKKGISQSLGYLGSIYYIKADYPTSIDYNFKALKIDEELNNKKGIASRLGNIGLVYMEEGNYPKAIDNFFKALKIDEKLGNKNGIATAFGNIGLIYLYQNDYQKSLDYFFKALEVDEELGNKNSVARHLGNIGGVFVLKEDFSKGIDYYFKASKMCEELGNKYGVAMNLGNIGNIYSTEANKITGSNNSVKKDSLQQKALDYYFKSLKIEEELGNKNGITKQLCNIGDLFGNIKKYTEAEKYLLEALKLVRYSLQLPPPLCSLVFVKAF